MHNARYDPEQGRIVGDGPLQRHMLLVKMVDALENAPFFSGTMDMRGQTPQSQWIAQVGALLSRVSLERKVEYKAAYSTIFKFYLPTIDSIKQLVLTSIEEIKLDLELDGRTEIGSAYAPGDVYRFFADLKNLVNGAQRKILAVDPYLNGETFNAYFGSCHSGLSISIICEKYASDVADYMTRHKKQFNSDIYLRQSKEIHDRIILIDASECWVIGGSLKDAGRKPTYLIPTSPEIARDKIRIYTDIWNGAKEIAV